MDKKHIRKEIATLINSIKEHSDSIGDKEHIPQLELELILHKIEKLYQKSIVFNHLNSVEEEAPVVKIIPPAEEKKMTPLPVVETPKTETPKVEIPVIETPKREIPKVEIPEVKAPEPELPKAEIKPGIVTPEEVKKEEPKAEPKSEEKKPVDLFGSELPPVTEKPKAEKKVEKKEEKINIHKIQKPPVSDIRAAIGINDKFQFANELFGGEMQEYEIAIQQLNTAETMASAFDYFNSLQQLYNWDVEHETVKRLLELVERRYGI